MITAIISIGLGQMTATTLFLAWWLPGLGEEQIPVPAPLPAALVQARAALPAAMQDVAAGTQYPDWPTGGFARLVLGGGAA